jgi:signal transduction histidine kinase
VGLMSLSLQNPVFFTCRAVTEVKAIVLTREQVRDAIQKSTTLAQNFLTVMMRTMARRNARAAELLTEVRKLNIELARQRDEMASTLKALRATQRKLIDSAKMATLGNLAAGMAHELNNPVGAMMRSAVHLETDIEALLHTAPELKAAAAAIPLSRQATPLSTREERKFRKKLAVDLKIDVEDAASLVAAGIHTKQQFENLSGRTPAKKADRIRQIQEIIHAGQVGASLRTISNCSRRISALVRSLKVYSQDDQDFSPGIDINHTLDDVLLILANKIKSIDLKKDYAPLPLVFANASQLQQVWTNLISNAVQALEGSGKITIRSTVPREGWVRVEIEDNGPGIPEEVRENLWDAHFTTRAGRVEFGLGLGLPIVRSIVELHRGNVSFESKPGQTVFTVELPIRPKD